MAPPAAETIRFQFLDLLEKRLQSNWTRALGCYFDVRSESIQKDEKNILLEPAGNLPVVLVQATERGNFKFEPANRLKEEFYVAVSMRADAVGLASDRKTKIQERLIGDLERCLVSLNDADIWWSPLPISDVRPQKAVPLQSPGVDQIVVVIVPLLIWIYRDFGQP